MLDDRARRRVELLVPIKQPGLREHLQSVLDAYLNDNVNARELQSDGKYVRVKSGEAERKRDAQVEFASAQAGI